MDVLQDLKLLGQPVHVLRILRLKGRIYRTVSRLNVTYSPSAEPLPFERRTEGEKRIRRGKRWGGMYDCAWFHLTGEVPESVRGRRLFAVVDVFGEGLAVDADGEPLRGLSHVFNIAGVAEYFNPPVGKSVVELPVGCDRVDMWIDCGFNGIFGKDILCGRLRRADLAVLDEAAYAFYFDYLAAAFLAVACKGERRRSVFRALNKAYRAYEGGNAERARAILAEVLSLPSDSDLSLSAVGHSHLDLAWLWPLRETARKAARTVATAVSNLEKFPDYVYGASQPQEFAWLKENHPALYAKVKKYVAEGRFELQGGMWCECDTNLTGGESLIRQFLYGTQFWEREFGVRVNNCWLPDVFGYTAALPQIIAGCGMKYFMTQKISWNEHNDFPLETFVWRGLSDDGVLVHLLPANTYNSSGAAPSLAELYANHRKKDKISDEALVLFGAGDGGGGPCETNIELIRRYASTQGLPKIKFGRADELFDRLAAHRDEYPEYKGELYLEKHQGTYTTQSNNKKYNRMCEYALHTLEAVGAIAARKGYAYPADRVAEIWKEVLLYQFHDILPGSAVTRVYKETDEAYARLLAELRDLTARATAYLAEGRGGKAFFNPAPYAREGFERVDGEWYAYAAAPYSFAAATPVSVVPYGVKAGGGVIENEAVKAVFDGDGRLCSVVDKTTGKEFNNGFLNRLNVYHDKKLMYNAWDIDIDYTKRKPRPFKPVSTRFYTEGAAAVAETEYVYGKSRIVQRAVLAAGKPYIEFDTEVDWHETHKMLRAEFRPSVFSDRVTCDIQFGNISRSTRTDNKTDWAQFEICAHKYADVSDGGFGCAVMSDGKYGYRVKDGLISLNLLRSPVYPDRQADRGKHRFRYAFYPHAGDCFSAEVPKWSYLFNLLPVTADGCAAETAPPVSVRERNIIVETVKPSEDGKGTVVRLYENEGKATRAEPEIGFPYGRAYVADMLEGNRTPCAAALDFKPYEIKTLYLD